MNLFTILLIIFAVFIFLILLGISGWLFWDRFYIRKKLLRLMIYKSDRSIHLSWGKKLAEKQEDNNLIKHKKSVYFYKPHDVIKIGTYSGIEVYENNFNAITSPFEHLAKHKKEKTALATDFTLLEKDSKLTTHPSILHLIISNKFLRELLDKDINWRDILMIVAVVLTAAILIIQLYYLPKILSQITANNALISGIPENVLRLMGKVA
jgi:hypothetical protein